MKYRFVLYGTWETTKGTIALNNANSILRKTVTGQETGEGLDRYLISFDAFRVARQVRAELDLAEDRITEVSVRTTPKEKEYICVQTPSQNAHNVWPVMVLVALREGLAALDVQLNRYVFEPASLGFAWRDLTLRLRELNEQIIHKTESIWKLRRLYKNHFIRYSEAAYVVTLAKSQKFGLRERTMSFYRLLLELSRPDETVLCSDRCFVIKAPNYKISYTIEAYRKNPDVICYMDKESICVEKLHRISCEKAFEWLRNNPGETAGDRTGKTGSNTHRTLERLAFTELVYRYGNPADRFCASLDITKALLKESLDVDYSCYRDFGPAIMFHKVPLNQCRWQDEYDMQTFSALKIEADTASFILPFIEEKYPYFKDRSSLADNHIPAKMLEDIKNRLKQIRQDLYNVENLEALEPYLQNASFYALTKNKGPAPYPPTDDAEADPKELIRRHRLDIAHLLDIFIRWAEFQLEYGNDTDLYNIIGP